LTEEELLNNIKNNKENFSELFNLYYKPIFGYIFRRTGDFDETADIAANTFLKAFNHIHSFSYRGISIKIWLYRIATNEINHFFRHKRKSNSLFENIVYENKETFRNLLVRDKEELETELRNNEQFIAVLKALKTLSEKYQEVISLRYFEGKDNNEIAEILNLKEGTVKSQLSRGLEKLRNKCNQI
jgi:RNA polymerase sigma-70 factor, ECF subfamily